MGRAFAAIRADELAADAIGINPTFYKVLAFTLGAILAGVVGAVSAHFLNTWNARQGTFDASIIYLTSVLIGGSRTFLGAVLGGMVFTALPEVLRGRAVNCVWGADCFGDDLFSARFGDAGVVEEVEEGRSRFCLKLDFEYRKVRYLKFAAF